MYNIKIKDLVMLESNKFNFSINKGFLEQGILLRDRKKLALRYTKSLQFKLDIVSLFPFQIFGGYVELRFNRLIQIGRILECRLKIETRTGLPFLFRIVYLIILILVIMHWNGCLYYILSRYIGFDTNQWVFSKTSYEANHLSTKYIACLFWSIHMLTTIGEVKDPTTTFESFVTIVIFFVAIVLIATLVGNIGSVISNMNMQHSKFQEKLDAIKSFMEFNKVDIELDERVIKWFDYLHKNNQTMDEKEIFANLPEKLQIELASHIHLQTLKNVNIFSDCEESLLRELVTKLRVQVYSPGDFVCKKGDIGKEMFIIKKGSLNVVSDDGKTVYVTLKAGSFFGELSILNIPGIKTGNRRTANVQSVGFSDLLQLTKNDLWTILADYDANKKQIINKGLQKVLKDNLLDKTTTIKFQNLKESNPTQLDDEIEFENLIPEMKLEKLENMYEDLLNRIKALGEEFDEACAKVDGEMEELKEFFKKTLGTTV